jgi:hypothetical protein
MDSYWGMEFVEVIDPKQPEGTRVDAMTYALLDTTGYYERLRMQCYAEQFPNVFYQSIIVPVLNHLDSRGITPNIVAVTHSGEPVITGLRDGVIVQIDDMNFQIMLRHEQLTDLQFPQYTIGNIAHSVERKHKLAKAQQGYSELNADERQYLNDVMEKRGFDEMDYDLYLNPHFKTFRDKGLITKQHGMYWIPSDDMVLMWRLTQES